MTGVQTCALPILYVFDVTPPASENTGHSVAFRIAFPSDSGLLQQTGVVRMRLYAVMRQLAYPPAYNPECTWFSPAIMIAAVISPGLGVTNRTDRKTCVEDVIKLSLDIEHAEVKAVKPEDLLHTYGLLDDYSRLVATKYLKSIDSSLPWGRLESLRLTNFSACIMDIDDAKISRRVFDMPDYFSSAWRGRFFHYLTCLCYPKFQLCRQPAELLGTTPASLKCESEFRFMPLRELVERYFPGCSSYSIRDDTISLNSPGRRVLLRSVSEPPILQDQGPGGDYNKRRILGSAAWNVLLLSLVAGQEAALERFHSDLPKPSGIAVVRDGLKNFDDFYDVDLFALPTSSAYREAFDALQDSISLDHQYEMLHKKLEVSVSEIHASSLVWAVVAFLFLALLEIIPRGAYKDAVVALFLVLAVATVVVFPSRRLWAGWADVVWSTILYFPEEHYTALKRRIDRKKKRT